MTVEQKGTLLFVLTLKHATLGKDTQARVRVNTRTRICCHNSAEWNSNDNVSTLLCNTPCSGIFPRFGV